jgi:GNAT superfamily N-acetyltransferase
MLVTRTYLDVADRNEFRPAWTDMPGVVVDRIRRCPASLFQSLYTDVGRQYGWLDRHSWSDDDIRRHLANPAVSIWVMRVQDAPAGYFELRTESDGSTELACFGLLPEFIGQGLGKHLLSAAVEQAFGLGARRVWLHTCTLDNPAALPNYLKRGFVPCRTETIGV